MALIALGKIVGGIGLLWIKTWAKWTSIVAALLHALVVACFGLPIWIRMATGRNEIPAGIPMWKDFVAFGVNTAIVVALLVAFRAVTPDARETSPASVASQ